MPGKGHNNPPLLAELTPELAEFVISNCDSNLAFGLNALQSVSRETAEKLVAQMENFKAVRKAVKDAQRG